MTEKKETPFQKYKKTRLENGDFVSTKKTDINKEISQAWKAMSSEEKTEYGCVKKRYQKKTGFDVFLKEALDDLSLTSTLKVNTDAVRNKTEGLWKRMSPEDRQKYEDIAGLSKKRKRIQDNDSELPTLKAKKKGAFDFYLDEQRETLDQKAIEFGFSSDHMLFMTMMTFKNLSVAERQKYVDLANSPKKEEPRINEVFLIVDEDENVVVKKEKV